MCVQLMFVVCLKDVFYANAKEERLVSVVSFRRNDIFSAPGGPSHLNTLRTWLFKLFKRSFPGFLTILTL